MDLRHAAGGVGPAPCALACSHRSGQDEEVVGLARGGVAPNFSSGGSTLLVWLGLVRADNKFEVTSNEWHPQQPDDMEALLEDERLARMS